MDRGTLAFRFALSRLKMDGWTNGPTHLERYKNKAVYAAYVAPRRPKNKSLTESVTDGQTDGGTIF